MTKNNTNPLIKCVNKTLKTIEEKDNALNEWKSIAPGCDSPYNMKNHIDKLHRDLEEWKSIIPDCHTPKLAAKRIGKIQSELDEWRTAVPNCETPKKLIKQSTKEKTKLTTQSAADKQTNFNNYINYITDIVNELNFSIDEITIENFYNAKNKILNHIDDPNKPDDRIDIIDHYKIIGFLIYEFDNNIGDPDVNNSKLANIKERFSENGS